MRKHVFSIVMVLVLCITLSGCSIRRSTDNNAEIELPEPSASSLNMILGEQLENESQFISLYYVSGDGTSFSTVSRNLSVSVGESIPEIAVNELLHGTALPERASYVLPEVRLLGVEFARGIATVRLSIDVHGVAGEQEYLMLLASITNTLLSVDEIESVNILIGDQAVSIADLPVGAQTTPYAGITPAYAQFNAESDYFLESETGNITRNAVLYFPSSSGNHLIPELREIAFDGSNYASALIRALRNGPQDTLCTISAIPESADLLVSNPVIETTSAGERVLKIEFASTLLNYLALSGYEEWQMVGSVALTLLSFVPDVDALQIRIGDALLTECTIGNRHIDFENGLIHRGDFTDFISGAITLYVPNGNGTLDSIERAETTAKSCSPLNLLYALVNEIASSGDTLQGVSSNDILGVSVENHIACVNLSADFYRQCQGLDSTQEQCIIYSIVNTLCELESISGVRFYIEGLTAETLAGSIYLKSVLMPNLGLFQTNQTDVEITVAP